MQLICQNSNLPKKKKKKVFLLFLGVFFNSCLLLRDNVCTRCTQALMPSSCLLSTGQTFSTTSFNVWWENLTRSVRRLLDYWLISAFCMHWFSLIFISLQVQRWLGLLNTNKCSLLLNSIGAQPWRYVVKSLDKSKVQLNASIRSLIKMECNAFPSLPISWINKLKLQ